MRPPSVFSTRRQFLQNSAALFASGAVPFADASADAETSGQAGTSLVSDQEKRRKELWDLLGDLPWQHRPGLARLLSTEEHEGYTVERLVLDLNGSILLRTCGGAGLVFIGQMEGSPDAPSIVIVGDEFFLFRSDGHDELRCTVRIDGEKLFVVVAPAVDERYEQAAGGGTEDILEDAGVEIIKELFAGSLLALLQ